MEINTSEGNGLLFWSKLVGAIIATAVLFLGAVRLAAGQLGLTYKSTHDHDIRQVRQEIQGVGRRTDQIGQILSCMYWDIPPEKCPAKPMRPPRVSKDDQRINKD